MSDPLDDLLDRSAPGLVDRGAGHDVALRQMVRDARDTVRPAGPARSRVMMLSGLVAALLVGSAGVATATSDWSWIAGLENPDRSYVYRAPTWGQCEIRFSGIDTHNPLIQPDVDRIVDEWFASTDVEAAAAPHLERHLTLMEESSRNDPEGAADPRLPDLNAWAAHQGALMEALGEELRAHGYDDGALEGSESHSQVHCEGEDWGGEGGEQ